MERSSRPVEPSTAPGQLTPGVEPPSPDKQDGEETDTVALHERGYTKASLGARLHAETIDGVVAAAPLLVVGFLLGSLPDARVLSALRPVLVVSCIVWGFYYVLVKDGWSYGQSIGKRKRGLMVVKLSTNTPCSRSASSVRTLTILLSKAIPVIGWAVEPLAVLLSKDGRRLGDRLAGTQVIFADEYEGSLPL